MTRTVVLLHGLWMPGMVMHWLEGKLQEAGYLTEVFAYMSVHDGPDRAVPRLVERIGDRDVDIVAHSLGGLIALQALCDAPQLNVRRVVCLGSPLAGSGAATALMRWPATTMLMGRSARLLHEGLPCWTGRAEVGMVAGCVPFGLGALFGGFTTDHDGTVSIAETRLDGLQDHVVVRASHSGLLFSKAAADQVVAFLHDGAFAPVGSPGSDVTE